MISKKKLAEGIDQRIIRQSYQVFSSQGFHASSVDKLAQESSTTKRTLYAHFASKDNLILEVLRFRHQDFMQQLSQQFSNAPLQTIADVATQYVEFLQQWIQADNFYGCLFINACAEFADAVSAPNRLAASHKVEVRHYLQDKFEQVGAVDSHLKADTLFLFGEGMIVAAQTQQQDLRVDTKTIIKALA